MAAQIHYGKRNVTLYRTYAQPLTGITPIPESAFTGRDNILFAVDVDVQVMGDNFLPAYTEGNNRNVVPTDTMKNLILQQALAYRGATLEGLLAYLGRQFLATYPQMQSLRLNGTEVPFAPALVPDQTSDARSFVPSEILFAPTHSDRAVAELTVERDSNEQACLVDHRCGRTGLQLMKLTGSAFANFAHDAYTTLPERTDRPLFIYLDVFWRYTDMRDLTGPDLTRYVAAEQVRDLLQTVFHTFVSQSIQHLLYEMGTRLLARFPQLAEVSFEGQNRLWDTAFVAEDDPDSKVYCDPRPPYGQIGLTLIQETKQL